ncbi:ferritin-like domain-containing protein [Sulfuriflexus mobilis]|uniref:ferritin-like domain-containing protein n=1 Tax=Sulfuriflexus mobilis TaxID=1811807 RepID=UPI000F816D8E|nr:ferritin-like domain-containing protein [Sulfuriflexus mobilis]
MFHINTDERVLGYLGRALSLELSAVQLYSTQSMLVASWGLTDVADKLRAESREEMGHAERIISRMLALGVAPNASQLRPVRLGRNLQELLQYDYAFENELISLYDDATRHCVSVADSDNRLFFEALLNEEKAHAADLTQWIQEVKSTET